MTETHDIKRILVCSAVGGVGRTTITVNLAALLAKENLNVRVLDADLQFGDIAMAFDLHPTRTLKDAAERKDIENILFYTMNHESGVNVLPAPDRPEYAELITTDFLISISEKLQEETQFLLIETQAGLNDLNIQLMETADLILVVSTPGMAALKNSKLMIETLELLGLKDKTHILINKFTAQTMISQKEIPELTSMEKAIYLPFTDKQIDHSLDVGQPFVTTHPKAAFSKELKKAASQFLNLNKKTKPKDKTGFFQSLRLKETGQGG
ncbi:AAA family ATPase [Oceanobacillus damuensis]|uniref:AAA family ATPase n=1 Tax=Oceanobacillus damuensis TaxID=937928 RepID=UPI000833B7F1|nr:P-loop NTPase [Oceanobacillus damuensis]